MANSGLFIALCAVLLAIDGSAQPVPAGNEPSAPPCKFTLEREAAPAPEDEGETWLLTCHREAAAALRPAEPVVQRRIIKAGATPGGAAL